ncbi:MAG: type II toxin-antitoxin system VapC family toxin [Burkholderiaceae bacterium]|nr:type II toxin-antitoxin system VapC family toxin [Burkholderiaceae bacterium]
MIAVDTSAIVAIVFDEDERNEFLDIAERAGKAVVSSVSLVEARLVVHGRRGQAAVALLDDLLRLPIFEVVAATAQDADAAYDAFVVYGKGSGHPASLNFGDLFSYALARTRGVPLLFKGDDFAQTDVASAR